MTGPNILSGLTVVDQTNLQGAWNFDITYRRNGLQVPPGEERLYFFDSLPKQLGLEIALTKVPMPALIVDSFSERLTDNPPDLQGILPTLPSTFEVAEIKPVAPDNANRGGGGRVPPGRVQYTKHHARRPDSTGLGTPHQ